VHRGRSSGDEIKAMQRRGRSSGDEIKVMRAERADIKAGLFFKK